MPKMPKPGGSVFAPRTRLAPSASFGKVSSRLTAAGPIDSQFEAAQFQHLIANKVRESILIHHKSLRRFVDSLSAQPTMTYERLSRIQRGETMMTLSDLLLWCTHFDEVAELASKLIASSPSADVNASEPVDISPATPGRSEAHVQAPAHTSNREHSAQQRR